MKNIGIWLDKDRAFVVTLTNGRESTLLIPSNIEHYRIHGGSGTRLKGGPQDVVQDSKYLERENHQFKAYFKEIVSHIKSADVLALFGPAGTNNRFKKELEESYKDLNKKVVAVKKADSMTENQMKALVRDFFTKT
jgi:stalled ribosome rescue protein Dom34